MPRRHRPHSYHSHRDPLEIHVGRYERLVLRSYAQRAFAPEAGASKIDITEDLIGWYSENAKALGLAVPAIDAGLLQRDEQTFLPSTISLRYDPRILECLQPLPARVSALQKRIDWIAGVLNLDADEKALLGAIIRLTRVASFKELVKAIQQGVAADDEVNLWLAIRLSGLSKGAIRRLKRCDMVLYALGLIEDRGGNDVAVSETVISLVEARNVRDAGLRDLMLGHSAPSTLTLDDFNHLGEAVSQAVAILKGALKAREAGVGLLLYGPPGTGKTEFARLLGALTGSRAVFIGEKDPNAMKLSNAEPSRSDRLSHLAFSSALAERSGGLILVVDEAEEIFTGVDAARVSERKGSKVFLNRLVEGSPAPTIWITNHPDRLGASVLRRMLLAVEFRAAGRSLRLRIIERHARAQRVSLDAREAERLAILSAPPALLESSLRATRLAAEGGHVAFGSASSVLKAMNYPRAEPKSLDATSFDASLSCADVDLQTLAEKIVGVGPGPLSFLLSGLPGTGKSAFARYLARRLELEVIEKRGSDLFGKYVGETEKSIADAFAEAADTRSFLILDEVDTFLADRSSASRSWEISQVNEMLTWMERHPMPFAATTNAVERLDAAAGRRFLFKVRFQAMTPDAIAVAFRRIFSVAAPSSTLRLHPLTPGDFAVVARKASIMKITDAAHLAAMLEAEVAAKSGGGTRIGF